MAQIDAKLMTAWRVEDLVSQPLGGRCHDQQAQESVKPLRDVDRPLAALATTALAVGSLRVR